MFEVNSIKFGQFCSGLGLPHRGALRESQPLVVTVRARSDQRSLASRVLPLGGRSAARLPHRGACGDRKALVGAVGTRSDEILGR